MPIQQMFLGYGGTTGPDIGTIQFGFDNSDNTFDTSSTSVTYNSSGLTYNTWSGSQLMSGLGGIGANSVQVWKTSNLSEIVWTISTDTTDRYIFTSSDGQNWTSPGSLYDTDTTPATVTAKYMATGAGANVSTVTVSGAVNTAGTYATLSGDAADTKNGYAPALSNNNLTAAAGSSVWHHGRTTLGFTTGKWYWEVVPTGNAMLGIEPIDSDIDRQYFNDGTENQIASRDGKIWFNGTEVVNGQTDWSDGQTIGVAYDADFSGGGKIYFYANGSLLYSYESNVSSSTFKKPAYSVYGSWTFTFNFGQSGFSQTPPTGYKPVSTGNGAWAPIAPWSSNIVPVASGFQSGFGADKMFNGNTGNYGQGNTGTNPSTLVLTPPTPIIFADKVEIWHVASDSSISAGINNGNKSAITHGSWQTVASGGGTLTTLDISRSSAGGASLAGVRIDNAVLVDST